MLDSIINNQNFYGVIPSYAKDLLYMYASCILFGVSVSYALDYIKGKLIRK